MSGDTTSPIPFITPGAEEARRAQSAAGSPLPATPTPPSPTGQPTPPQAPKTWQQEVDEIYQLALSQIEQDNNENLQDHTIVFNPTGNSEKDWVFCLFDRNGNKRKISTSNNSELDKLHKRLIAIFSVTRPIASRQAMTPPAGPSSSTRATTQPIQPPVEPSLACASDHTLVAAQPPQTQVIRNPLQDQLDAARREIDALRRQTADLENALRQASREISEVEHRATSISQQAHDDMRRLSGMHDDLTRKLLAELENERSKNRSLLSEKADQERRIFDLERQIGLLRNEITTKESDLEDAKRELNSARYEIRVANESRRLVEDDLLAAHAELQEMDRQFAHITEELAHYHELAQRAAEEHERALRELQFARNELEAKLQALNTAERRASTAENSVRRLNSELEDLRSELESLRQSEIEANERAQRAESHANSLSAKIRGLTVLLKASEQKELAAAEKAQRTEAALRAIKADADRSIGDEKEKVNEAERKALEAEDNSARLKEELEALRRELEALRLANSEASERAHSELAAARNQLSSTERKATDGAEKAQKAEAALRAIKADADKAIGDEKEKVKEAERKATKAEDDSARLKEELEALKRELEALRLANSEASEKANSELAAARNQLSSTEQRATAASSRAKRAENALARTKEETLQAKQNATTAENRAKEAAKALSDAKEQLLRTEQAKKDAETKASEERRRATAAETELSALRGQFDPLRKRAESAETELRGANAENARARDSERRALAQEQEAKRQTKRLEESLQAQKAEKDDSERRAGVAENRAREAETALYALRKQLEETQRELAAATQPKALLDAQTQAHDVLEMHDMATQAEEFFEENDLHGAVLKQHPDLRSEYQKLLRKNLSKLYATSTLQEEEQERRLAATQRQADVALVELERTQRALQEREQELNAFRALLEQYGLLKRGSIHDGDLANLLDIFRSWESLDQKELLTHFEVGDHARLRRNLHLLGIEKINFSKDGSSVTITFKDGALIPFPQNVDRVPKLKGKTITLLNISGSSFPQFLSANGLSLSTVYKDTVEFLRDIHNIYHDIKSKNALSPDKIFVEIEQNNNEEVKRLTAELLALKQIKGEEKTQRHLARIDELSKEIQVRKALTTLVHGNNSNTKRKEIMRSITPRNILTSLIGYFDRTNIAQDPSLISEIIKLRLYQSILYDISKDALNALEPQIQEGAASAAGSASTESRRGSGSSATSGKGKGKAKA